MSALKKKSTQVIIILAITAAIALAGTFAWNSFMQQRINTFKSLVRPGVNLHDDFLEGPNKDVYVENSGQVRVFVRVRLTEYLETAARGSLIDTHVRDEETAKLGWFPHNGIGGKDDCEIHTPYEHSEAWPQELDFHTYYEWKMGGQKWYMPALIQLGEEGALADNPEVCSDLEEYEEGDADGQVQQTLWADVITMDTWFNGGYTYWDGTSHIQVAQGEKAQGNFWVVDTDGWCYWAQGLEPKTATGLLLDEVKRTNKQFDSSAEYAINVWLQAADEIDIGLFEIEQNGGITESGKLLTRIIADAIIPGGDGLYQNNRDGSFTQLADADGAVIPEAEQRAFVPIGSGAASANLTAKVGTEHERLYIGQEYKITHLNWDGEDYVNYTDFPADTEPYYNITDAGETGVTIKLIRSEIGIDGNIYLRAEDEDGNTMYLSSTVLKDTLAEQALHAVQQTQAPEQEGTAAQGADISPMSGGEPEESGPDEGQPDLPEEGGGEESPDEQEHIPLPQFDKYVQGYPGTGPFAMMYAGGDRIGTKKDTRYDTSKFKERLFRHIGSGVYIEVAKKGDTVSMHSPVTYFFARQILEPGPLYDKISTLRGIPADDVDGVVNNTFPLTLTVGEGFDVVFGEDGDGNVYVELVDPNGTTYTMSELEPDPENPGGLRIPLGEDGYISVPEGEALGGAIIPPLEGGTAGALALKLPEPAKVDGIYNIKNRADMDWLTFQLRNGEDFAGETLKVAASFGMGEKAFVPVGTNTKQFLGTFDGQDYTISGLKVEGDADYRGLFGYVGTGSIVKGVKLDDINVSGKAIVGGVVGYSVGTVENCHVLGGVVTATGNYVGGIVGNSGGTITGCSNSATLTGGVAYIGGIAGIAYGNIENCGNVGEVNVPDADYVGGVVGQLQFTGGTVEKCFNTANVTGRNQVGGVAGITHRSSIANCYVWGDISGDTKVGGVIGYVNAENSRTLRADFVYHSGNVEGNSEVGGLVGHLYSNAGGSSNKAYLTYAVSLANNIKVKSGGSGANVNRMVGLYDNTNTYIEYTYDLGNETTVTTNAGYPGNLTVSRETTEYFVWWTATVGGGFADNSVWTWDSGKNLPVLGEYDQQPEGAGTEASPFMLTSREDMDWLTYKAAMSADGLAGQYFEVVNDFSMGTKAFYPVGSNVKPFMGTFDGDDKTISNLLVTGNLDYRGLFGHLGAGGTIKNVKLADADISGKMYVGGIAGGNNSTIENCHVREGTVIGSGMYVGGIAGYNFNSTTSGKINNSSNSADITGGDGTGGIVGTNLHSGCEVTRSYNTGNITGNANASYIGGISGGNNGGAKVENCYSIGNVEGSGLYTGGVSGNNNGTVTGAYHAVGTVRGNNHVGGVVGYNTGVLKNAAALATSITATNAASTNKAVGTNIGGTVTNLYALSTMNLLQSGTGSTLTPTGGLAGEAVSAGDKAVWAWWLGTVGGGFADMSIWTWDGDANLPVLGESASGVEGAGTAQNPYKITSRKDMDWLSAMASVSDQAGIYFELSGDIDMGGTPFYPIGSTSKQFNGSLDGGGHTISNLVVVGDTDYRGLFGYIGVDGTVTDLTLDNLSVAGKNYVGGIAGRNDGTVTSCEVNAEPPYEPAGGANISNTAEHVGGIAGYNTGSITDCHADIGKITASANSAGGIVGWNEYKNDQQPAIIANCTNSSYVEMAGATGNRNNLGGIAGWSIGGSISYCVNTGTINNTVGRNNGGITGGITSGASVTNCRNEGDVTAPSTGGYRTGGIVGYAQPTGLIIENCVNIGSVSADSHSIGGIAGHNDTTVQASYNTGSVSGTSQVGGVVGNTTNADNIISKCYNTGSVNGTESVGGVVGYSVGAVRECYADLTGGDKSISGSGYNIGGVIGYNNTTQAVKDCYMWGDVLGSDTASDNAGGVIGNNNKGNVSNVYHAKGTITGHSSVGGIIGLHTTGNTVSHAVALAQSMVSYQGEGRAIGLRYGTQSNVYAWKQMPINGNPNYDATGFEGIDTGSVLPSQDWWITNLGGTGGFDFTKTPVWEIVDGLPVLTGIADLGSEGNPYRITSRSDLDALAVTLSSATDGLAGKYYAVTQDITMGAGTFVPIGTTAKPFKGTFDGSGKIITGLTITGTNDDLGLFGIIGDGGKVKNVVLSAVNVSGNERVGGVVGKVLSGGKVENCRVLSGTIISSQAGGTDAGGVVGLNIGGTVQMSYSAATVTGIDGVGGVVGRNQGGTVQMSYSAATVTGNYGVGGVVGMNQLNNGQVLNCYAEGNVGVLGSGGQIGGVVGYNLGGTVSKTYYAKGTVQGLEAIAGIAGGLNNSGTVTYNVAYSGYVNGTSASHINKIRGYIATTCTENNNYSSSEVEVTNQNLGYAGDTISPDNLKETQDWWQNTVGFNFTTIWRWDNTLKRPVLQGVTQ